MRMGCCADELRGSSDTQQISSWRRWASVVLAAPGRGAPANAAVSLKAPVLTSFLKTGGAWEEGNGKIYIYVTH